MNIRDPHDSRYQCKFYEKQRAVDDTISLAKVSLKSLILANQKWIYFVFR